MNETEWLDYFETINNRKPSEEEIQQAKANGEFVASEPVAENSQPQVQVSEPVTGQVTPVVAPKKACLRRLKLLLLCYWSSCTTCPFFWWLCLYPPTGR